ncbi:MAG TPA: hypothetical protein VK645_11490 [Chitinophagaceae bacterium]|nr:hypothetical protein [Chitinophagaceae bacterium]
MQKNDVARIYDTVLSIPGMNEKVKVNLLVTRKNLLLLNKVIERGLNSKDADDKTVNILDIIGGESLKELKEVAVDLLDKAGLTEMNEKLRSF